MGDLVTTVPATSSRLREKRTYGRCSTISFKKEKGKKPSRPDTSDKTACLLILEDENYSEKKKKVMKTGVVEGW